MKVHKLRTWLLVWFQLKCFQLKLFDTLCKGYINEAPTFLAGVRIKVWVAGKDKISNATLALPVV